MQLATQVNPKFSGAGHDQLDIGQNMGLIRVEAYKLYKRLQAVGAFHVDFDDALQIASMKFVNAARGFNAALNNKFSTYYIAAMRNVGNNQVDSHVRSVRLSSVEELKEHLDPDGDVYEVIASEVHDPFEALAQIEEAEEKLKNLSVLGRFVVACLVDPPAELRKAREEQRAAAELGRAEGRVTRVSSEIDLNFIIKFYQISRTDEERIKDQLRRTVGDARLWRRG